MKDRYIVELILENPHDTQEWDEQDLDFLFICQENDYGNSYYVSINDYIKIR